MVGTIVYKSGDEKRFWSLWSQYLFEHKSGPNYLKLNIDFHTLLSKERGYFLEDKSFVYEIDGRPLACVFLLLEKNDEGVQMSMEGGYLYAPLFANRAVEKEVMLIIDSMAKERGVEKIMFAVDPLEKAPYNYLQKYHYLDTSILSYIADLTPVDLLKACRKGHISDIKRILRDKDFETVIIEKENLEHHKEYERLHHLCSGRVTRSAESFDIQHQKLIDQTAILVGLSHKGKMVAYSYFEFNAQKGAYASGVDDPQYSGFPLYHILVYTALLYLQKKEIKSVDMSQPSAPSSQLDYYPDKKQLNIALFKRGFSGNFWPSYRGVKYFSRRAWQEDQKKFVLEYTKTIQPHEKND